MRKVSPFRHTVSTVYAMATRCGSRVFHASSAALTVAIAVALVKGGWVAGNMGTSKKRTSVLV
jgi:hypothetical protein